MSTPCNPLLSLPSRRTSASHSPSLSLSLSLSLLSSRQRIHHSFDSPALLFPTRGPAEPRHAGEPRNLVVGQYASIGRIKSRRNKEDSVARENFLPGDLNFFPAVEGRDERARTLSPENAEEIFGDPSGRLAKSKTRGNRSHNAKAGGEEGGRSMKVQERFRKEALLIGKSWSLWTNAKCQVFSSFGRRDHTLLFKRVDDENVGGGGRGRNDSDVRFADKVYRCVISQMASHLSAQRFGPCRRVTSRMASTMLFTSRAFPPLFFFLSPPSPFRTRFPFNARFSRLRRAERRDFMR